MVSGFESLPPSQLILSFSLPSLGLLTKRRKRLDYFFLESAGISEPLPVVEPRLGRRTVLTFPLLPPPQKN